MALTATIYQFTVELSHVDRGIYETLDLRVARQPSEAAEYMVTRLLAYCLEYAEGIARARCWPGLKWACPTPSACTAGAGQPSGRRFTPIAM
jgi:uncharacterized protein YaeQ